MSRLQSRRKLSNSLLMEVLEDRRLLSHSPVGAVLYEAADSGTHGASAAVAAKHKYDDWTVNAAAAPRNNAAEHHADREWHKQQSSSRHELRETRSSIDHEDQNAMPALIRETNKGDHGLHLGQKNFDEESTPKQTRSEKKLQEDSDETLPDLVEPTFARGKTTATQHQTIVVIVQRIDEADSGAGEATATPIGRTSEAHALVMRDNPKQGERVAANEGQFVMPVEDRAPAFSGSPEVHTLRTLTPEAPLGKFSTLQAELLALDGRQRDFRSGFIGSLGSADAPETIPFDCPTFAAYVPINAPENPATLSGAGLVSGEVAIDTSALDEALRQFMTAADDVARSLARGMAGYGMLPWLLAIAAGSVALEARRRKRAKRSLAIPSLTADDELSWVPGMPGAVGDDDA